MVPALDPSTPIYAAGFSMALIQRRLQEFNLWDESRFHTFKMRERFQLGPFECVSEHQGSCMSAGRHLG